MPGEVDVVAKCAGRNSKLESEDWVNVGENWQNSWLEYKSDFSN